jgi:hypothetical protein
MRNFPDRSETMMDKMRMFQWVLISLGLYAAAALLAAGQQLPQVQIVLWKLGHITLAAFVGYWVDRRTFHLARIDEASSPVEHVRRAIIIGAAMLAIAMGL